MKKLKLYFWFTMSLYLGGIVSLIAALIFFIVTRAIGVPNYTTVLIWLIASSASILIAISMAGFSTWVLKIDWNVVQDS